MATLKYLATERAHLSQVPISEGQFIYTTDTEEVFYDVAHDIRFKTNKLKIVNTDTERYRLSNNDQVSTDLIYYIKESELFYVWTSAWKNVVATTEITRFLGDYKNVTPTTLVKGEERFAPMTIASQVYTDDGETLEAKVRQISHIASAFDSIVVTKKGKTFDIPVPFERYFDQPNMLLVFIGTLQIYPNRYSIEANQITFQEEVEAGRTINFYFIYNAQAPKLETMNYIDGAYINKGTVPIDRMQKYSHSYTSNDTTSVASSAAVKSLYDKMNALLDRGGIITRCVTKDDNVNMGTTLPNEYKLLDGNVISVRFHANVGNNPTLRVDGKAIPIFVGFEPAKANEIQAGDELYLQYDYISERFYVTNGLPYLIDSTTYSYAVLADGENVFRFNTLNYDPGVDRLEVFHNGVRLIQGKNYKFIAESKSISLVGYTADKGDVIEIVVYKVARSRATNNSQVTVIRPDFESLTRSLGEALEEVKAKTSELKNKSLDVIFPMFGPVQVVDEPAEDVGECAFVGIDKKYWFIVDTFSNSTGGGGYESIKRAMRENGINKFEFLLITHWHGDHYGNAIKLMRDGLVGKVYVQDVFRYPNGITGWAGMPATTLQRIYNEHKAAAIQYGVQFETAPTGNVDFHGANLYFHNNDDYWIKIHNNGSWANGDYNNTSIGLLVSYIGRNYLTQGDAREPVMAGFAWDMPTNIDLMKSHHHSLSNMPWKFKKVKPKDVVITCNQRQIIQTTRFDYQDNLASMGSNLYFVAKQYRDIHITYRAENNSVEYNKELTHGYPDLCAQTTMSGALNTIYVDPNTRTDISTGDSGAPLKYLSDAVRMAHINNSREFKIALYPGDYTTDKNNYNFFRVLDGSMGSLQLINFKGRVKFVNIRPTEEVILPPMYIFGCNHVVFEGVTFKNSNIDATQKAVEAAGAFYNMEVSCANAKFINCKFGFEHERLINKATNDRNFNLICVDAYSANVTIDSCTFYGKAKYGIRSTESSTVNIIGDNTVSENIETVYYATDGDIHVNGTANRNTSNETTGGGQVRFQDVVTPSYQNTSRGQIIGTRLSQRYGGPQYYISDGRGGYDSVDHFNIHGNTNMTPSFTGQFGYDPRSKKVKFAVGNSNINDWVEFANSDTVEAAKTSLTSLVNNMNSNLVRYIELQTGYRMWTNGATFAKGEKFIYQGKAYQVVSNNAVTVNDNNARTLSSNSNIIGAVINLEGNSVVQYFDRDDAHLVGELVLLPYIATGYVLANGAEVEKSRYPRLYDFVEKNGLWTTDTNKRGLFRKSGSDKFFLPDYRYVYLKADVDTNDIGKFSASVAPRITGEMEIRAGGQIGIEGASGAFVKDTEPTRIGAREQVFDKDYFGKKLKFDASISSRVYTGENHAIHPDHINLYPLIKY
jgi:metallo-beta-lactamase superfamily